MIQGLMKNGCKYLNLRESGLQGNFDDFEFISELRYLDVAFCEAENEVFEKILKSCRSIEKLSLAKTMLNQNVMFNFFIQNGQSLKAMRY